MKKVLEIFNMADWAFLRRGFEEHGDMYQESSGKVFMYDKFSDLWRRVNIRDKCHNVPVKKIWNRKIK